MENIINSYKKWKESHDEGYCYDEIHDFIGQYSRGDLLILMDYVLEKNTQELPPEVINELTEKN